MCKAILLLACCILLLHKSYSQEKPKIYLSGINGNSIKRSQLSDTTIKIVTNSAKKVKGIVNIYFSGGELKNVITIQRFIGAPLGTYSLNNLNKKLIAGSIITIDGYLYIDDKTKERIYFLDSSYTVIDD